MKYKMVFFSAYVFVIFLFSCHGEQQKTNMNCEKARKLTIQKEGKNIANEDYSIVIMVDKNKIHSRIVKDSLYYTCLGSFKDSLITVIFKERTREYRIDSIYKNIFDMPQDAELIFRIDLPPYDSKQYGYSEEILSKNPKEIFSLVVNPNEYGIGRRFIGVN